MSFLLYLPRTGCLRSLRLCVVARPYTSYLPRHVYVLSPVTHAGSLAYLVPSSVGRRVLSLSKNEASCHRSKTLKNKNIYQREKNRNRTTNQLARKIISKTKESSNPLFPRPKAHADTLGSRAQQHSLLPFSQEVPKCKKGKEHAGSTGSPGKQKQNCRCLLRLN